MEERTKRHLCWKCEKKVTATECEVGLRHTADTKKYIATGFKCDECGTTLSIKHGISSRDSDLGEHSEQEKENG